MNSLLVADSFLVANGTVRGLDLHRHRFTTSCKALGFEGAGDYWDDHVTRLPGFGRWFPRFELWSDGLTDDGRRLALQARPAPPQGGRVRVAVHEEPDPRTSPRVKGPDLEMLGALKAEAAATQHADEILLLDADGTVLEAAYSAVVWWEDDTLCTPPADRPLLPSVTVALLRDLATTRGIESAERSRTPADLMDREVWLLNALHGIRPIHAWNDGPIDPLPASHSTDWQHALLALSHPL
ncbi:MAG TPA: aminotransferase class IV [Kribbella sp.]|uniref:aminotransferase class IV n=1 Tax=Kribbella sp. TaxID=1871183 RepID=UPI002D76FE55|nr:aminotransferase class IV [Kribbella sp.]HET6297877.1 aminotransferase class IV [Kribbella sp.]